jgi:hypothetical protein
VPSKASKATALLAGGAKALLHLPVGTAKATVATVCGSNPGHAIVLLRLLV